MPQISSEHWDRIVLSESPRRSPSSQYFTSDQHLNTSFWSPPGHPQFALALSGSGYGLLSHPFTFAGGIAGSTPPEVLSSGALSQVCDYLVADGLTPMRQPLTIRAQPDYYFADWSETAFWAAYGARIEWRTETFVINLADHPSWSKRRRRSLALALAQHIEVSSLNSPEEEVRRAWDLVESFYSARSLRLSVNRNRIQELLRFEPGLFRVLIAVDHNSGVYAGVALLVSAGQSNRLPIYVADTQRFKGATELLIQRAMDISRSEGKAYLDLGTAVNQSTGLTDLGIAAFKRECGAQPRDIFLVRLGT